MDPISAVGLIASAFQLASVGAIVLSSLHEIYQNSSRLVYNNDRVLGQITSLKMTLHTHRKMMKDRKTRRTSANGYLNYEIEKTITSCINRAKELESILREVQKQAESGTGKQLVAAIRFRLKSKDVRELENQISKLQSNLTYQMTVLIL